MAHRKPLPSKQYLEECFLYEDGILYWRERPSSHFQDETIKRRVTSRCAGQPAGYASMEGSITGYTQVRLDGVLYQAHRIIYKMLYNEEPENIDHIDRDKSNNKAENLRAVSPRGNSENSSKISHTGATHCGGFRVRVRYKIKTYHIGVYKTLFFAKKVYSLFQEKVVGKDLTEAEIQCIIATLKQDKEY